MKQTPLGRAVVGVAPSLFLIVLALSVLASQPRPAVELQGPSQVLHWQSQVLRWQSQMLQWQSQVLQWQRQVLQWQLPDFEVQQLEFVIAGPHQVLRLQAVNRRYLVMQEQVVPPGTQFEAQTPARSGHVLAALMAGAAAALLWNVGHAWIGVLCMALPATLVLWLLTPTVVLAGSVWGLGVVSLGEISLAALQVAAADFLLRGGGYFVVALLALACRALGRRSSGDGAQ